jgi:hypothetical protein
MPFVKGNQLGKANKGRKKETPKTVWLLQSLQENGVNLQELLAKSILKASHGDRQAMDLAHLLAKLIPHVANAPKNDVGTMEIETLVINRFEAGKEAPKLEPPAVETEIIQDEGNIA